jgi:hypothetical protein
MKLQRSKKKKKSEIAFVTSLKIHRIPLLSFMTFILFLVIHRFYAILYHSYNEFLRL